MWKVAQLREVRELKPDDLPWFNWTVVNFLNVGDERRVKLPSTTIGYGATE